MGSFPATPLEHTLDLSRFTLLDSRTLLLLQNKAAPGGLQESDLYSAWQRATQGVAYTPKAVATELVDRGVTQSQEGSLKFPSILDPACGTGAFVVAACESLLRAFPDASSQKVIELVEQKLFGIELDPRALEITKIALCRTLASARPALSTEKLWPVLDRNFRQGNFLIEPEVCKTTAIARTFNALSIARAFPEMYSFDLIIGNPPYGLSRDGRIEKLELATLKQHYGARLKAKPNKYLLFLLRSLELLSQRGILSFLIPNSWLGIQSGKELRRYLIDKNLLEEVIAYPRDTFKGLGVEVVNVAIRVKRTRESVRTVSAEQTVTDLKLDNLRKHPDYLIPIGWSTESEKLVLQLEKDAIVLESERSPFGARIALQAYANGKGSPPQTKEDGKNRVFHSTEKLGKDYHPYLEGKDVLRFGIRNPSSFLHYGPWLAEPQKLARFTGPRLLIREVLGRKPYLIQATFVREVALYNKSILHIRSQESDEEELLALLAVLNSQLASQYFLLRGRKSQRSLFPKLVVADLKSFPLPPQFFKVKNELAALARKRLESQHESTPVDREIDQRVRSLYGLKTILPTP